MPFQVTIEKDSDIEALGRDQVAKAILERSEQLHKIFEQAGETLDPSKVTEIEVKDGRELAKQIEARNSELTKLGKRRDEMESIEDARKRAEDERKWANGHTSDPGRFAAKDDKAVQAKPFKSAGLVIAESPLFQQGKDLSGGHVEGILQFDAKRYLEEKAAMTTAAGWAPQSIRIPRVILDEQRPVEVTDFLPVIRTSQAAIVFMEETTFTNAAAERNENASYAESALALTERSKTVRSVGTSLPVTDEQLADVEGIGDYIDARLMFMVRQRLDSQILVGDAIAPNLEGTINVSGINTQAKGTDNVPDAIYKGMDLVRVTGRAIPNVVFFHPNDWQPVRLLKTADGVYIWGSPSDAGPDRIWGLPVVQTTAVTENTAVTGDYARFSALHMRQELEVLVGYVSNDFLQGRKTMRAGLRCAVVHYRPSAFTKVTGL